MGTNTNSASRSHADPAGLGWTLSQNIAYTSVITYTDGTTVQYKRRERPHLIFSNVSAEPIALVTAVFARQVPATNASGGFKDDYSFTSVQPIAQGKVPGA